LEYKKAEKEFWKSFEGTKTAEELNIARQKAPDLKAFAERFKKLAEAYPDTPVELKALFWAALNSKGSDTGKKAAAALLDGRIQGSDPGKLLSAIRDAQSYTSTDVRPFAEALLACAKKSLDHPKTADLLSEVCIDYRGDESEKVPAVYAEAADLIASRFAASPDISHFAEMYEMREPPPWSAKFEKHLRTIVDKNREPLVMAESRIALAKVVRSGGDQRREEALKLFREFVAEYDGKSTSISQVVDNLVFDAKQEIQRLEHCRIGKPAQEIEGTDLQGKPIKLSDHRGKVVLLVFWASTCIPCMADVPHEKKLVEQFQRRPFVLIGINGDPDKNEGIKACEKAGMTWRSIWDDEKAAIHSAWAVSGIPTTYIIDHEGIVRHYNLRGKKLDDPLTKLIEAAEESAKRK
jgi:peroxiredoxin